MHARTLSGIAVAACALLQPVRTQSFPHPLDFSQTVAFGDSLTANELLGFPFRFSLYGADPIEAVFRKAARSGDRLNSYAVPGVESNLAIAEIAVYAGRYLAGDQKLATLISFEIGANDLLNDFDRYAAGPPGANRAVDAQIDRIIDRIFSDLLLLYLAHPRATFVVWTLPDVTYTPKLWHLRNGQAGDNFRAHLARINGFIRWTALVPEVVVLDTETLIRSLTESPPTLQGSSLLPPPAMGRHNCLFADDIHPTAVGNALVANAIIDALALKFATSLPKYTEAELAALARIR